MSIELLQRAFHELMPFLNLRQQALPLCSSIQLWLLDEGGLEGALTQEQMLQVLNEPAYWSFCWASGQVLASYLSAHTDVVKGKRVLDFGSGSGVAGIAAALAGAREVVACDVDPIANLALGCNAQLNKVDITSFTDLEQVDAVDLVLASDVLYDKDNFPLIECLKDKGNEVLIADSRVKQFPDNSFSQWAQMEATTWPDLAESQEFNQVTLYYWKA